MANATGWGGKRAGGGRPSKFSIEQKKTAAAKRKEAIKKKIEDAQELVVEQMIEKAREGHWEAIKWLAEHSFGRPTARQETGDHDFTLKLAFDRTPKRDAPAAEEVETAE